ncbi:diguanylate cyclase [Ectothiorhodospiraceae bacterium WFHF3C12]|nr:diguanylate cyclase [Ectothiorhodospiraceae bacterium WFHF3C12]
MSQRAPSRGGGEGTQRDPAVDSNLERRALEAVGAVADALYEDVDFNTLARRALDELIAFMGVPTAVIYELDSDRNVLKTVTLTGRGEEILDHTRELPLDRSVTGRAVMAGRVMETTDVPTNKLMNPEVRDHLMAANLNVVISVPLQHHGLTVGAVNLLDEMHRHLADTERETLLMIGRIIAMALTHARNLEQIRSTKDALRQANEALEARVVERTRELTEANERLEQEVQARRQAEAALRDSESRYRRLSITDGLTGLYNHRHFYTCLEEECHRARQTGTSLSLLLIDVDNFKQFNDTYGHPAGDHVLATLATVMRRSVRGEDLGFRYGGEEFTVLLPQCDATGAYSIADRLREAFRATYHAVGDSGNYLSVSIGGAQYEPEEDPRQFVHRADQALYRAKRQGKNCVCLNGLD